MFGAHLILPTLLFVNRAINFDHEFRGRAIEVEHEWTHRMLATESQTTQLSPAQRLP